MKVQNGWEMSFMRTMEYICRRSDQQEINKLVETEWKKISADKKETRTISLSEVISAEEKRIVTADAELNRVLGGGIVRRQHCTGRRRARHRQEYVVPADRTCSLKDIRTLYISGEESEQQIKMRADRLNIEMKISIFSLKPYANHFPGDQKTAAAAGHRRFHPNPAIALHRIFRRAACRRSANAQPNFSDLQKRPVRPFF